MEVRDYAEILRRRWWLVLVVTLATVAAASALTLLMTPKYTAATRLFFGVQAGESVSELVQGSTFTESQMTSYAEVATSPLVLDRVIDQLDLTVTSTELAAQVTATAPTGTVILEIEATDPNPGQAARIANSIGEQLTSAAGELVPERPDGSEAVRATILARAEIPADPSSPKVIRNLALGLALGLLLGAGLALLRHALDTRVRSELDIQSVTDSAVLGAIPFDPGTPIHPLVMHDETVGVRSEAVRRLRTNLQFVDAADQAKSVVITSSIPGEGKSVTAINLAVALADAGLKVILVDADLRRPSVAQYLGLEGGVGLTTVLIGRASVEEVVQPWDQSSLDILPSGQVPPNPSELLGSQAMSKLLSELTDVYDMVLLDSPPLLPVTDAALLSKFTDGTLVVIGADRVHRAQLRGAIESLITVGANLQGLVLNKVARQSGSYGYGYTYSTYSSDEGLPPLSSGVVPGRSRKSELGAREPATSP